MIKLDHYLLDKSKPLYIGFSGGYDSLVAAHFLKRGGWDVRLLHVKHFDNDNSSSILNGVTRAAIALQLPLTVLSPITHSFELYVFSIQKSFCNELGAFTIRDVIIRSLPYDVVIVHTLNDLAETYLQNCIKGNPSKIPLKAVSGNKVRPFLRTKRRDIEEYAFRNNIESLVVPDHMPNQRAVLRSQVFPALNTDLTSVARRLFIDNDLIYS